MYQQTFEEFLSWIYFMGLKDTKSYTRSSVMVNQLPGYSSILVSYLPPSPSISQLYSKTEEEIDRHTDRPAHNQIDRRTDRQTHTTDRQVDRATGRQTDRQAHTADR